MYGKSSWGGDVDPFILATFITQNGSSNIASMIIYEYSDYDLIGVTVDIPGNGTETPEVSSLLLASESDKSI
jgi:hypothetical protein